MIGRIPIDEAKKIAELLGANVRDINEVKRAVEAFIKIVSTTGPELLKAISTISKGDGKIFKAAMETLRRKGGSSATDVLNALNEALGKDVPGGKMNVLGTIGKEFGLYRRMGGSICRLMAVRRAGDRTVPAAIPFGVHCSFIRKGRVRAAALGASGCAGSLARHPCLAAVASRVSPLPACANNVPPIKGMAK